MIVSINGSPFHLGKRELRQEMFRAMVRRHNVPAIVVNQVGGNDQIVFDGTSFAMDADGNVIASAASFAEDLVMVDTATGEGDRHANLPDECEAVYEALVLGTRDYIRKCGFERVLIGLSGGIDSSLTAVIAVDAVGRENVRGVAMPGPFSSDHSVADARAMAERLGFAFDVIPDHARLRRDAADARAGIRGPQARRHGREHPGASARPHADVALEQVRRAGADHRQQERDRGRLLHALRRHVRRAGGDQRSCRRRWSIRFRASPIAGTMTPSRNRCSRKPPSAELRPDQKDSDSLPPYDILDGILRLYIEENHGGRRDRRGIVAAGRAGAGRGAESGPQRIQDDSRPPPGLRSHRRRSASAGAFPSRSVIRSTNENLRRRTRACHVETRLDAVFSPCMLAGASDLAALAARTGRSACPMAAFCSAAAGGSKPPARRFRSTRSRWPPLITPDKKFLLVLNGGYNPPSISVIDIAGGKGSEPRRRCPTAGWASLCPKPATRSTWAAARRPPSTNFRLANGVLKPSRMFPIVAEKDRKPEDFIGDVQFSPDGHLLYAADLYRDSVVVVNPQSGLVISRIKTGRRPYRILFHPSGKSFYVSSWADGSIGQYEPTPASCSPPCGSGPHTTDMVWREGGDRGSTRRSTARLFVSASNTNSVYVLGATESGELSRLETINLALTPRPAAGLDAQRPGPQRGRRASSSWPAPMRTRPRSWISRGARSRVLGFVPTGWYPTAAFGLPDGRMGVLNGKGLRLVSESEGAESARGSRRDQQGVRNDQYVATHADRHRSVRRRPRRAEAAMRSPGKCSPTRLIATRSWTTGHPGGQSRPAQRADQARHLHREGEPDLRSGAGRYEAGQWRRVAGALRREVTPNLHKIAREFVLLDNFYVNSDVSADGHNWATAAIAPDYTQRMWPSKYAGRATSCTTSKGRSRPTRPPAGYIWTNAAQAGISLRNYG